MNGVLREIMKEDLVKEGLEGEKRGAASMQKAVAERMIDAEKSGDEIELFTSLSRHEIDSLARLRNRSVRWETTVSA